MRQRCKVTQIVELLDDNPSKEHTHKEFSFYREDTGEKLLIPEELAQELKQAQERAKLKLQVEQLKAQLRALGVDPDTI